jgi:hypothetical protein
MFDFLRSRRQDQSGKISELEQRISKLEARSAILEGRRAIMYGQHTALLCMICCVINTMGTAEREKLLSTVKESLGNRLAGNPEGFNEEDKQLYNNTLSATLLTVVAATDPLTSTEALSAILEVTNPPTSMPE